MSIVPNNSLLRLIRISLLGKFPNLFGSVFLTDVAVADGVSKVDAVSDEEPNEELDPSNCGKRCHLHEAGCGPDEGNPWEKRHFKWSVQRGLFVTKNENTEADNSKYEESPNRDELR